tara:strand:- start:2110 stop:3342 length:1233 start_codon:yes stop_codon:yes gene_type:complete
MAVSVDWNTGGEEERTKGIFGIYNRFVGLMSIPASAKEKVQFRIRVTAIEDTSITYVKDVNALSDVNFYATVNPVESMQELFFRSDYTGILENKSIHSYGGIRIEIGEVSAIRGEAPTFLGYDTNEVFYFYNGYDLNNYNELNYRDPLWYDTTPHKLPKVKKTIYVVPESSYTELLSMPSYLNVYPAISGGTNLKNIVFNAYDSSGGLVSTSTIDLRSRPELDGVAYWNFPIQTSVSVVGAEYAEVFCQWAIDGIGDELVDSETITVRKRECHIKDELYRLRWINHMGGEEYQDFALKHDKSIQVKRGKKIASTGINYSATTFSDISNINNPSLLEYGTTYYTKYKLRTNFITQGEIDAMRELFVNKNVIMNDSIPVIVEDSSYKIVEVKDGLQKVEINVRLANFEPNQI